MYFNFPLLVKENKKENKLKCLGKINKMEINEIHLQDGSNVYVTEQKKRKWYRSQTYTLNCN